MMATKTMLVCMLLVVSARGFATEDSAAIASGHRMVESKCSRCHAIGLDDTSAHPQAPPFRNVVQRYPPEQLAEALAEGIMSGHPDMPEFVFQPDEVRDIIAYLNDILATVRRKDK